MVAAMVSTLIISNKKYKYEETKILLIYFDEEKVQKLWFTECGNTSMVPPSQLLPELRILLESFYINKDLL